MAPRIVFHVEPQPPLPVTAPPVPRGTVIAVSNQKGGVGKTTSVINIAACCAAAGRRTLVVDLDPQANASSVLAPDHRSGTLFTGQQPIATAENDLWVIPTTAELIDEERQRVGAAASTGILAKAAEHWRTQFAITLIDCPPNLAWLTTNALVAADYLILPLQSEYFALEGLGQLLAYIEDLKISSGAHISLLKLVLTMHDNRHPMARQVEAQMREHFSGSVCALPVPRDIALAAASSHARSILAHDPLSRGAIAYLSAAREVLHVLHDR